MLCFMKDLHQLTAESYIFKFAIIQKPIANICVCVIFFKKIKQQQQINLSSSFTERHLTLAFSIRKKSFMKISPLFLKALMEGFIVAWIHIKFVQLHSLFEPARRCLCLCFCIILLGYILETMPILYHLI